MLAEKTIDDEIAEDWKAISEKYAEPAAEAPSKDAPAPEPVAADSTPEPSAETEPTPARARDESGKFVKQEKPSEPTPPSTPEPAPAEAVAPETPTRDINRPPSSWKPAAKAAWQNLPPDIRAEVHRRESDFLNGQSKLLPDAKFGQSMRQVVDPYRALIDAEGGTPERAVADLLRTAAVLRMGTPQQKLAAIQAVAQQFGVALPTAQIGAATEDPAAPAAAQQFRDPRVDQLLQQQQQAQRQREAAERAQVEGAAQQWLNEMDEKGAPKRPYVDDVMTEMNALVPQIRQSNPSLSHSDVLQQAYDRAIWAHPEIRPILQKERDEQLEAKRRTENQDRVNLARKASSVNVPRRASIPAPAAPGRMEDTILETARALGLVSS